MPELWIHKIVCNDKSESSADEIYLKIDGHKVWPNGDYHEIGGDGDSVNVGYNQKFSSDLSVALIEHDEGHGDDHLVSFTAYPRTPGHFTTKGHGDGGNYEIHFEVRN